MLAVEIGASPKDLPMRDPAMHLPIVWGELNPKIDCLAVLVYIMLLTQRTLISSIANNFWRDSKNTWRL